GAGAGMESENIRGGMMRADDFGQVDSRFIGFTENTFTQVCSAFGVSIDGAISDLGLAADIDRGMTIGNIELQYDVKSDDIANYMVVHMRGTTTSFNARNMAEMKQQAMQGIREQKMVSGLNFMKQGSTSYGHYVTYTFNESGEIKDFALSGDAIFDSVRVSDFDYSHDRLQGAVASYVGTSSLFLLHDNPTAIMQVKALDDKTVTFNLAEGVEAEKIDDSANNTVSIKITKGNLEGYLILCRDFLADDMDVSITNANVDITDSIITVELVKDSQVMFRATPMEPQFLQTQYQYLDHMTYMYRKINQGVALGRVGAELTIRERGNTTCLLNYTPVNLQVKEAIRNRVVIGIESEMEEGQVITINLDNETINLTRPEYIRLRYDGVALGRAANIDELFAGGNEPLCYLLQENETASMAVYIPEFSEHEIIIDLEEPEQAEDTTKEEKTAEDGNTAEEEASSTPAFGVALALATIAGAYIRRRS
ncbi:MAG: MAST domain-containing protein, partial [Methanosarcinaceae archaeon]